MTQDTGPSRPGEPRFPPPGADPSNHASYGSNPYSAGPARPGTSQYWGQPGQSGRQASSVNAVSIVQVVAGVVLLVSLLLPWFDLTFGYLDTGGSSTFVTLATNSDGLGQVWLDLVLLGIAVALVGAVVSMSMRAVSRSASAIALAGFGLVTVGSGYYLVDGAAWDYSILSPGPGVYLCLLAAVVGGLAAVVQLANPRLGTTRAAPIGYWGYPSAPPSWASWPGATHRGPAYPGAPPPWDPQHPAAPQPPAWPGPPNPDPYPPGRTWPPQSLVPTHQAGAYPSLYAPVAQLVVLEAGQSRMLSVRPGEHLLVGRDADAQVRLADPAVQPRHATIERRGNAWVVRDLQTESPSRLMDASGSITPVGAETTVEAGQLLIGSVLLTLYQGQP
jgi:hypothetical protein